MLLGSRSRKRTDLIDLDYVFKAKMVTFWEVSRLFAENALSARKTAFLRKFAFFARIFAFSVKSCAFPVLGPQKTSQNLVFIKGFEQGTHRVAFGAQKCTLGPRIIVFGKYCYFWCQWLEKASDSCFLCPDHGILQGIPTFWEGAKWCFVMNFQLFA